MLGPRGRRCSKAGVEPSALAGVGITNQRETTLVWSRTTGQPIHNAIVWQDRRTAPLCAKLKEHGCETLVSERAGFLLDPYFSATKIAWLLDNVPGARTERNAAISPSAPSTAFSSGD